MEEDDSLWCSLKGTAERKSIIIILLPLVHLCLALKRHFLPSALNNSNNDHVSLLLKGLIIAKRLQL